MGDSYVFTLDVEPSGNMRVTIADEEGESATWPGIFHADPALDLQLPVPPSWWAAAAIETDYAPESGPGPIVGEAVFPHPEIRLYGSEISLFAIRFATSDVRCSGQRGRWQLSVKLYSVTELATKKLGRNQCSGDYPTFGLGVNETPRLL